MSKWINLKNCIENSSDAVIFTHTNMDGDAIGSSMALCRVLRKMGKNAVILLEDDIPRYLKFMVPEDQNMFTFHVDHAPQLAIAVDCGDESRIEKRIDVFRSAAITICIDHHEQKGYFADFSVVEPDKAATGILMYQLLTEMHAEIDKDIAEDLYVAIVTDTGRFKYSNTTAEVHRVIADLYAYNIDHVKICNEIYDSYPLAQLRCEAIAQEKMEVFCGGKAVISSITTEERERAGAGYDQIDTCIDRLRIVEGVEIAAFIKEKAPGVLKLSLRAKTYANVNNVAVALGGGGHIMASGATLNMTMEEAYTKVKAEMEKEMARHI